MPTESQIVKATAKYRLREGTGPGSPEAKALIRTLKAFGDRKGVAPAYDPVSLRDRARAEKRMRRRIARKVAKAK